jgi:hypothetical protein
MNDPQGFDDKAKLHALGEIAAIRSGVNEQFGKTGNTTTTGITTGTGLVSIPLEAPAKSLYSVYTKLRQRITRESDGKGGLSITWRALTSIFGGGLDAGIAEGAVGSTVQFTEADVSATYKTLGRLATASYEAISAGQTFDDVMAKATLGGLQNLQVSEEMSILGGCTTGIAKPGVIGTATTATAGSLANGTSYDVAVSAVTLLGTDWVAGTGARGNTGVDVSATYPWLTTHTDSPNETDRSNIVTSVSTGAGGTALALTWPSVPGAFAYNVYSGTASSGLVYFNVQVTVPAYTLKVKATNATNVPNTSNETANSYQFDGISTQAALAASANWTDLKNASLTAGVGSVNEIDTALETMFRVQKVAPTLMVVSGHEANTIRNLILANGSGLGNQRFNTDIGPEGQITGGSIFLQYRNPYFEGMPIEVLAHPYMPQGTALIITEKLPPWYPNANIGTTWAIDTRRDFYSIEYAIATSSGRVKPIGVYCEEVLKGYFPLGTATLTGIGY